MENAHFRLAVPEGIAFSKLELEREPATGRLLFFPAPLAEICRFNKLDPTEILADEDLSCWLICQWYLAHREARGEPDRVAEEIVAEIAELEATAIAVLQPGSGAPN